MTGEQRKSKENINWNQQLVQKCLIKHELCIQPIDSKFALAKWTACERESAFFGHVLQRAENMCLVGVVAFSILWAFLCIKSIFTSVYILLLSSIMWKPFLLPILSSLEYIVMVSIKAFLGAWHPYPRIKHNKQELGEWVSSLNPVWRCCALIQTDNRFKSVPVWSGFVQTCVKDKVLK